MVECLKNKKKRHVLNFDPQTKTAKNLTENLEIDKMPIRARSRGSYL